MRKEVFLAILAGTTIGLVFAFGVSKIAKKVKVNQPQIINKETPLPITSYKLAIKNLKDFDVINNNPFLLSGSAQPNLDIIVSTSEEDYYVKANEDGSFEIEIDLPAGLSEIRVNDMKLTTVFSTEVNKSLTSYIGTITDISSGTIQLKNANDEILQASTDTNTTYSNLLKKLTNIKESDLAIGDYVAVLGKVNGNKVLKAERILVTSPIPNIENKVEEITIETLSKTKINDITLSKTWKGPNIKDLEVGQRIITVGVMNGETYTLRSIFTPVE